MNLKASSKFPVYSQNLQIREWTVQDGFAFYHLSQDKEFNACSSVSLRQENQDLAEQKVIEWALITNQTKMGYFPIFLKTNSSLIGVVRLKPTMGKEILEFEITTHLGKEYLGNGFSQEAALAIKNYAIKALGIEKLSIRECLNDLRASLPNQCKILAASKLQNVKKIEILYSQGQRLFAENYAQEAAEKQSDLSTLNIQWHFIGHLQKNKIKQVIGHFDLIHSVDSKELAISINSFIERNSYSSDRNPLGKQKILLQVNLAEEETKGGFNKNDLLEKFEELLKLQHIQICGLMTMPPLFENPEEARPYFRELKKLLELLHEKYKLENNFCELSMGTSSDFRVAAEEGATIIRLGTALFGSR